MARRISVNILNKGAHAMCAPFSFHEHTLLLTNPLLSENKYVCL